MPEGMMNVPAAVFVITQDDIRRSGARSIPEALRLAPGLQVARINAGVWSVGVRGFADRLARSMLVLIDGRAVYSSLFAGTYWETQDTLMADIERIEIIRGPGGTLWGANAVNGIINIITKAAADTQGTFVTGTVGSQERGAFGIRYGGEAGRLSYRVYGRGFSRAHEFHEDGNNYDRWRAGQAGFRGDWHLTDSRNLTVQGDVYRGVLGARPVLTLDAPPWTRGVNRNSPLWGGNLVTRLTGGSESRSYQLQMFYDHTLRDEIPVGESRDTVDVDFQQTLHRSRNSLAWGAGYRASTGAITAMAPTEFLPARRTDNLFSAFLQDEVVLVPQSWRLTLGAKVEHNDYSGVEVQPSARLLWTPSDRQTIFVAASRAVRTPSRVETDYTTASLVAPGDPPTFVRLIPNPDFRSEAVAVYELGYRARPIGRAYVTASGFFTDYRHMLSTELGATIVETDPVKRIILPVTFGNGLHGDGYGAEITGDVRATTWLRLTGNYSYLSIHMTKNAGSRDASQERRYERLVPDHQFQFGASADLPGSVTADMNLRRISALPAGPVPAYTSLNLRVGFDLTPRVSLSVVGQDLLHDHHLEWFSAADANVLVRRSVYAGFTFTH
jgi:iron complex outermembrane receptor protein